MDNRLFNPRTRKKLREIIFGAETPMGKFYDIVLIIIVIASVVVVMTDSVASISNVHAFKLNLFEWFFTIMFTIDYIMRIYSAEKRKGYICSFFGVVDLLSIVPTYLSLIPQLGGAEYLAALRFLRILRTFRVLKLSTYQDELNLLVHALQASARRIMVFLLFVLTIVVVLGSMMYTIEGQTNDDFTSIPKSIYWAIVTLTTVGYGDIKPETTMGQTLAAIVMFLGYSIIVVPTGIVVSTMSGGQKQQAQRICDKCSSADIDDDASFCKSCGHKLTD